MAALQIVMENQLSANDRMSASEVQGQMVQAGFSKLAGTLSLRLLEKGGFMESVEDGDINGNTWWCSRVTPKGVDWLLANQELFQLRHQNDPAPQPHSRQSKRDDFKGGISDDDVPFWNARPYLSDHKKS